MDIQSEDQRKAFQVDFSWSGLASADLAGAEVLYCGSFGANRVKS